MKNNCYVGVDLGSSAVKAVMIDEEQRILARVLHPTGLVLESAMDTVWRRINQHLEERYQWTYTVSTGYGRHRVSFSHTTKPEIICHARGVFHSFPQACTVIDIGGQDNKVIHMDHKGNVTRFRMNTKCAAGTGAFLEEISAKARLDLGELHELATHSVQETPVNSFCTVFAMTEVLKKIMSGEKLEDIARGIYISIAERIREIYRSSDSAVVLTGGVIENNPIMIELLAEKLGKEPLFPERPQFTGALGAALFAREIHHKNERTRVIPQPESSGITEKIGGRP